MILNSINAEKDIEYTFFNQNKFREMWIFLMEVLIIHSGFDRVVLWFEKLDSLVKSLE